MPSWSAMATPAWRRSGSRWVPTDPSANAMTMWPPVQPWARTGIEAMPRAVALACAVAAALFQRERTGHGSVVRFDAVGVEVYAHVRRSG